MGWASASYIFNDVATTCKLQVAAGEMTPNAVTYVLTQLAGRLMDGDWDTVDESAREFALDDYVILALIRAGYDPRSPWEDEDEDDED